MKNDTIFLLDDKGFINCNREAEKMFGASSVQLKVIDNLNINLSGASRLEYAGRPVLGKIQVAGASVLKQR